MAASYRVSPGIRSGKIGILCGSSWTKSVGPQEAIPGSIDPESFRPLEVAL